MLKDSVQRQLTCAVEGGTLYHVLPTGAPASAMGRGKPFSTGLCPEPVLKVQFIGRLAPPLCPFETESTIVVLRYSILLFLLVLHLFFISDAHSWSSSILSSSLRAWRWLTSAFLVFFILFLACDFPIIFSSNPLYYFESFTWISIYNNIYIYIIFHGWPSINVVCKNEL